VSDSFYLSFVTCWKFEAFALLVGNLLLMFGGNLLLHLQGSNA